MSAEWYDTKEHSWQPLNGGDLPPALEVVGHCTDCGCPIFGPRTILQGERPVCTYSCNCWMKRYVSRG